MAKGDDERVVVVKSTGEGKFQQSVSVGKHSLLVDGPISYGGEDTGPAPYDLLCISLGACQAMTLGVYAEHKGLPLEDVEVRVSHEKIKGEDGGEVDRFTCNIKVIGDELTEEQRSRILQIADKCPVHKTLHSDVIVDTKGA